MKIIVVTLSVLAVASFVSAKGTAWKKCKLLGSDLCFETVLEEIIVKIGNQGTNDDVVMEICSDYDTTKCCKTPPLKSLLADDWSKGDTEKWGPRYFGACKDKKFKVKRGLRATLSKNKNGKLNVTSIVIDTKSPDKKNKETERFQCGGFQLGGSNPISKAVTCKTGPYEFMRIEKVDVQMGNDGTDDDVKMKICSDANDVCCEKKLSHTLKDDWKKNKLETWKKSDFGDCAKILYKINSAPIISVQKNGKDDLVVTKVKYEMTNNDDVKKTKKWECENFALKGDCKNASLCRHTFSQCKQTSPPPAPPLPKKKGTTTTRRPTKKTTSRPPFRSGR